MQNNAFSKIAHYYDIYSGASYDDYLSFILRCLEGRNVEDILDLGCGTGTLTALLGAKGYGMVGVDSSEEMLSEAKSKYKDILFLQQDMREFELYGTVQAAVCTYDGFNYLHNVDDLKKVFMLLHNYLEPHSLLIFDINTLYKYKNILSDNAFVYENEDDMLIWQNYFNEKTKNCNFYLTLFEKQKDGKYIRSDEFQRQKCFSVKTVEKTASECGFELKSIFGGLCGEEFTDKSEKAIFVMERGE